jgi:hypothetical protein
MPEHLLAFLITAIAGTIKDLTNIATAGKFKES